MQAFLAHNRGALRKLGIYYPAGSSGAPAYEISHHAFFDSLQKGGSWLEHLEVAPTTLISAEDLFDMATAHTLEFSLGRVEQVARILAPHDPKIVAYLRPPEELLVAHYGQFIKGSPTNHLSFEDFRKAFAPRLDASAILDVWRAHCPDLVTRPYTRDIVPDFFRHVLEMEIPSECQAAPDHPEYVNRSVDRDTIELIRLMNRYGIRFPSRDAILAAASSARGLSEWGPDYPGLRLQKVLGLLWKALQYRHPGRAPALH